MAEYSVSFGGHQVLVEHDDKAIAGALDFMFADVPHEPSAALESRFSFTHEQDKYVLGKHDIDADSPRRLASRDNLTDAANFLMGEVIYSLIVNNREHLAIHAALLSKGDHCFLMPGESGSGKSSMTLWMVKHGYQYHTDELVLIDTDTLKPAFFPRPLNIKSHGIDAVKTVIDLSADIDPALIMRGEEVTMFAHRLLSGQPASQPVPEPAAITHILFPRFAHDAPNTADQLSAAASGLELMKTNVIGRNRENHGFQEVLSIVKRLPAHLFHYNHFDELPRLLAQFD